MGSDEAYVHRCRCVGLRVPVAGHAAISWTGIVWRAVAVWRRCDAIRKSSSPSDRVVEVRSYLLCRRALVALLLTS